MHAAPDATHPPLDGHARNKRATRRALRAAVLDLGLAHGLDHVQISAIAEQAGVSKRTFFNYFDTKEDAALIELFSFAPGELAALATSDDSRHVWDALTTAFLEDLRRSADQIPELPRYLELHSRHPVVQARQLGRFAAAAGDVADAVHRRIGGHPDDRLRADLMAASCITAVRVGLEQWARNGFDGPVEASVDGALSLYAPSFKSPGSR